MIELSHPRWVGNSVQSELRSALETGEKEGLSVPRCSSSKQISTILNIRHFPWLRPKEIESSNSPLGLSSFSLQKPPQQLWPHSLLPVQDGSWGANISHLLPLHFASGSPPRERRSRNKEAGSMGEGVGLPGGCPKGRMSVWIEG